jgi:hypothetical protein
MIHLAKDPGVIFVNRLCELLVALDLCIIIETGNVLISLGIFIDCIVLGDEKTPAAFGLFLHIFDVALSDHSVFRAEVHDHCRHDQPVGNLAASDLVRCKQFLEHFVFLLFARAYRRVLLDTFIIGDGRIPRSSMNVNKIAMF